MDKIDDDAKLIWDYHLLNQKLEKSDAIFVLCSMDTRVAERGAELYKRGYGDYVIISGGIGKFTKDVFNEPEAEIFREIMISNGVPADKILVENKSTNTGENIQFTCNLLLQKGLSPHSFILVQKPYMERRTYATFMKQWPGSEVRIFVTSPKINYEDYFDNINKKELVLNVMVGDLQRIREYPKLGYQIEQDIPPEVWKAYERMVAAGYTKHLIT